LRTDDFPAPDLGRHDDADWRPLAWFFALAFAITWGVGGLALLAHALGSGWALSTRNPLYYLAAFGPSVAGLIMAGRLEGRAGVTRLLSRAVPTRAGLPWYVAVMVGFTIVELAAGRLEDPQILTKLPRWDRLLPLLVLTLVTDPGPVGEEFGWRGFALPRLLRRRRPLAAALMLGLVWGLWHLPTFFIPTLSQSRLSFPIFLLNSVALSVIMTWLYRRTDGDLALMILVHLMSNYSAGTLHVPFHADVGAEVACAALIVAAGGLRSGARLERPADHPSTASSPDRAG
jgi:membrane protease YdiL (CAAX protease family)